MGDRIAKAKMHGKGEMAAAAKRLIAEKKKNHKCLEDSRKAKISVSEVVKAKKQYQIEAKRAITEEATKREKAVAAIQANAKSAMTCELKKRECIEMELCTVKEDAIKDREKCEKAEKKVSEIYANAYALNANESASKANSNSNSNSNAINANAINVITANANAIDANAIHAINTSISTY